MTTQFIIIGIIAFAAGTGLAWFTIKTRFSLALSELKGKLLHAEEKMADTIINLSTQSEKCEAVTNTKMELEKTNAGLIAQLAAAGKKIEEIQLQVAEGGAKTDNLQAELTLAIEQKAIAERDLFNRARLLSELQASEESLKNSVEEYKKQAAAAAEEGVRLKAQYEESARRLQEQQEFINGAKEKLNVSFQALSAEALERNNHSFVTLAKSTLESQLKEAKGDLEKKEEAIKGIIMPLNESLKNMDQKISDLEGKRVGAYRDIWNYLDQVKQTTEGLKKETTNLVGALKTSHSRGRYGEIALKRLVEYAGMVDHCHFEEQVSVESENGKLRPDMIIKLPESKRLVVDSKVPLAAYLKMFETDDPEQQRSYLALHVEAVKDHLKKLSAKAYWSQFDDAPDFVILYMHIESSFGSALQAYPGLIEEAFSKRIIVATPTILISILMSVGYSWNQLKTMENIEEIRSAAVELFERSTVFINHIANLGGSLDSTIKHYNSAIGSLELNFMPQARKINHLSQAYTKKILKDLEPTEMSIRKVAITIPESIQIQNINVEEQP